MSDEWRDRIRRFIPILGEYLGKIVAAENVKPLTQWTLFWAWRWRHECPKGDENAVQAWVLAIAREFTFAQCCTRGAQMMISENRMMDLRPDERRSLRLQLAVDDLDPSALKELLTAALELWRTGPVTPSRNAFDWYDK